MSFEVYNSSPTHEYISDLFEHEMVKNNVKIYTIFFIFDLVN
jgi:hypothetical protein